MTEFFNIWQPITTNQKPPVYIIYSISNLHSNFISFFSFIITLYPKIRSPKTFNFHNDNNNKKSLSNWA